jgi:2-keto-4-pentenoate hydratase
MDDRAVAVAPEMKLTPVSFRRNVRRNRASGETESDHDLGPCACTETQKRAVGVSTATTSFNDELEAAQIARRFTGARLQARALADYPGPIPLSLDAAYRIQEAAISQWPDRIVGWKLGRIPDPWVARLGAGRLAGPVFSRQVLTAIDGVSVDFPVFEGGFAAVEAEFIFKLGADQPRGRADWSIEDAAALVDVLIVGVEPAGSPLATINELGPCVVVSDFGNNAGLILGPEVADWRSRLDTLTCETWIEGERVGRGGARTIPNGPLDSLRVLLEICQLRDRPLKAGDLISTGAATGIHDIVAGQSSRVVFDGVGEILCRAIPRQAETD